MIAVRATVTCSVCGHRQVLERLLIRSATFRMICHECEASLSVTVTDMELRAAGLEAPSRTQGVFGLGGW